MKSKNPIKILLENGIKLPTLTNMSEKQIKVLSEKFEKSNITEITSQTTTTVNLKTTKDEMKSGVKLPPPTPGSTYVVSTDPVSGGANIAQVKKESEGEISEKFESKAQQGLFWSRCNKSKGKEKEHWCTMAKEFSDSTTKKEYATMPEKKHPEKTVKYKKTQKENYEQELEDRIVEMIEKHIDPKITKGGLTKTISEKSESMMLRNPKKMSMFSDESGIEMKTMNKPIGKLSSMGKSSMEENDTKEKERTKEKDPGTKNPPKRRGNPFKDPNPGVKEKPRGEKEEIKQDFIHWIKQALS